MNRFSPALLVFALFGCTLPDSDKKRDAELSAVHFLKEPVTCAGKANGCLGGFTCVGNNTRRTVHCSDIAVCDFVFVSMDVPKVLPEAELDAGILSFPMTPVPSAPAHPPFYQRHRR